MRSLVQDFASAALDRAFHPLGCKSDKSPIISREKIKDRPPTWKEIDRWECPMVGLICGNEVNPVLAIDFDQAGLFFDAYKARVMAERPELWARLTIERSMSGGYHIWIKTKRPFMTQKLAHNVIEVEGPGEFKSCGKDYKSFEYHGKWIINPDAIETRGATKGMGSYCVCAPSPGYELLQGKILSMPLLEDEEVDYLLSLAREFETYFPEPKEPRLKREVRAADGDRPGDDFNARGEILPILEKHGWTVSKEVGYRQHLARPGKTGCTSATLTDERIFYPFSSNSHPFEADTAYSPFSVYALLEHDGDFAEAAGDLATQGYGNHDGESDWNPEGGQTPGARAWPAFVPFDDSPPDLPRDTLPGILGRFAEGLAEATQTPRELSAVNVLGVVALAVQHKLIVRVKFDYAEGVNLYALVASEPGERKSAIVTACKEPLVEWEAQQEAQMLGVIQEVISHRKTLEKAIDKARIRASTAKDADTRKQASRDVYDMERELPEVPALPRLLVDDCTPEALAEVMAGNGESIGMLEAEGGALDTLGGRYSSGVPNLDLVLKGYSAEPVTVDRKGKQPIRLRHPRITMILTPQPSVLRAAGSNQAFMGRGLIGRCLLILPRPLVGFRDNDKTMPETLTREWHDYINSLLAIPAQTPPCEITLSKDAYDLWIRFSQDVEHAQRPGEDFEFIRAWASKATGLVIRIAGLFHLAEGPGAVGRPIPATTMLRAISFTTWASIHAKYAFSSFGMDEGQEAGKRALEWLRRERKDVVTANELYQAIRGRFQKMEQVRPGIKVLVDRGALVPRGKEQRVGRPSDTYEVNPAIFGGDHETC